ncbi:MAG: hypothetical protein CR982_05275 [Candidatus Cloacimonadota bacterium]|nr:MAG: hypothetical protein CR982_05275 [Candidatus Cloacimonadota bacterium]PIE78453.1 MAG: hypothetical protein CSA15_07730 [Candidatus Delongbacteria bacterium]
MSFLRYIIIFNLIFTLFSCTKVEEFANVRKERGFYYDKNKKLFTGKIIKLYHSGEKNLERSIKKGVLEGRSTVWFKNGKIMGQGYYIEGKREGEWSFFNENGSLKYTHYYKNGKRVISKKREPKFSPYNNLREQPQPIFKLF